MLKSAFSLMKQQNFQELGNIFRRTRLILLFKGLQNKLERINE